MSGETISALVWAAERLPWQPGDPGGADLAWDKPAAGRWPPPSPRRFRRPPVPLTPGCPLPLPLPALQIFEYNGSAIGACSKLQQP